ncbi:hypothetical protein MTP04_30720 [Lysinibacillus sp. PLM2]|nr:hypothetical protein MTP04_30720 [Lysinibacillus sp. PLM2]
MKKAIVFSLLFVLSIISGCSKESFTPINHHQSFIASINISDPSVNFYDHSGEEIAKWSFDNSYTGGVLLQQDRLLLYGHQLTKVDIYELSSGEYLKSIDTGLGITNAYFDDVHKILFLANSQTNTVTSFDEHGNMLKECKLGDYPMSMTSYNGQLYVINYKDTKLSIVNIETMEIEEEWTIEKSSNGILIIPEKNEVWIGGHGEGSHANQSVSVLNLTNGKLLGQIDVSIMPVGFARNDEEIYVINHGANELYATNLNGDLLWKCEVGANPFAIASFYEQVVVAGFDDHKLYFLKDGKIIKTVETGRGPFQLLVREVKS